MEEEATTVHSVKKIRLSHLLSAVKLATGPATPPPAFTAAEIETVRREAYQRGFEDASAMIETQLLEQREEVAHLQEKTLQALAGHHEALERQLRAALPELTMEIVRRVLGSMEPDQEAVFKIVSEVLQGLAPGPETVEVCLSGRDLKLMVNYQAGLRDRYPQIEFRVDPDLQPGDCIVTSRFGALDGRLATKLRSVDHILQ
jgi:flagellar biosynthesis/type III secretory pathway protein FliH